MLVPVQGGVANLQKRNRQIFEQQAALSTVAVPDVYIFNVGPREWRGIGGGKLYVIPPCPKGQDYSDPVAISALCLSEIDHADGGNNLGVIIDAGMSGTRKVGDEVRHVIGVANDVIGTNSTAAALELTTTNGEWFGLFVTANEVPTEEELEAARGKLRQMMQLIYATGAEKVQAGEKVAMLDRPRYNEAAEYLGAKPLWGNLDHTRASCPECHEDIIEGANFCKHCQQAIDPASVAARATKRKREAAKLLKDEEEAAS
jgi:hypothetical protein